MKPDILQLGPQLDRINNAIAQCFTVHRYWEATDKQALLNDLSDRLRFIVTTHKYGPDAAIIQALPKLELVASFGAGMDGIDLDAAQAAGVIVTNTPNVLNDCVAELTLGLMVALTRNIVQGDAYTRAGRWASDGPMPLQQELTGCTVGILGLGRIGKEIARRCQAFRMHVVYHGRNRQPDEIFPYYANLEDMARDSDWLIVVAPSNSETRHLVNSRVLTALGSDGYLVSVGRGATVDEAALVAALRDKKLRGAALDVFEEEPHPHKALLAMKNVILSPHTGSATFRTRNAMADIVVENLHAHLRGRPLISRAV